MKKLLLLLMMVLLATAPPLLAETYTIETPTLDDKTWGGDPENYDFDSCPHIFQNTQYPIGKITVRNEAGEEMTSGTIVIYDFMELWGEPSSGIVATHDGDVWNEGWTIQCIETSGSDYPLTLDIYYFPEGTTPPDNPADAGEGDDEYPIAGERGRIELGFFVDELVEGAVYDPTIEFESSTLNNFDDLPVFFNQATITINASENNPEDAITYYVIGDEDIIVDDENGKYEIKEEIYNWGTSQYETITKKVSINETAQEYTGPISISASELNNKGLISVKAVSATETAISGAAGGEAWLMYVKGLSAGGESVALNATEEAPVDLLASTVTALTAEYSLGNVNLSELGATLYYTIGDGEATAAEGNTINLTDVMGVQKITAWLQKSDDASVKTNPVETFVKLYTPETPAAPEFFTKRGPNTTVYNNDEEVTFDLGQALQLQAAEGTTIYYTTGDASADDTEFTEYTSNIILDTPGVYTYTAKAVLTAYPSVVSTFTTLKVTVSTGVYSPSFYLNTDQNDPLSQEETAKALVGEKLIIKFFNNADIATFSYTVKETGGEASAPIQLTLDEYKEAEISLDQAGTFTYTGIAANKDYPDYPSTTSVTIEVIEQKAPAAPTFSINDEQVELEEGKEVEALVGDMLGIASSQSQDLGYTIVYTMAKEEGEATEPETQAEEGDENAADQATVYTEPILLDTAGTFTVTAKAYLTDNETIASESIMTLVVKAIEAPTAPTFTINGEAVEGETATAVVGNKVAIASTQPQDKGYVISYKLGDGEYETYTEPLTLENEGQITLTAKAALESDPTVESAESSLTITVGENLNVDVATATISFTQPETAAADGEEFLAGSVVTSPEGIVETVTGTAFNSTDGIYSLDSYMVVYPNNTVTFNLKEAMKAQKVVVNVRGMYDNTSLTINNQQLTIDDRQTEAFEIEVGEDGISTISIENTSSSPSSYVYISSIEFMTEQQKAGRPEITLNEETNEVTIVPGANAESTYYAVSQTSLSTEEIPNVEYQEYTTPFELENGGYVYAYSESEAKLKSDYVSLKVTADLKAELTLDGEVTAYAVKTPIKVNMTVGNDPLPVDLNGLELVLTNEAGDTVDKVNSEEETVWAYDFTEGVFTLTVNEAGKYHVKANWEATGLYNAGSAQLAEALTIYVPQALNVALSLGEGAAVKYAVSTDDSDPIKVNMTMTVDDQPIDIALNDLKLILTDSEGNDVDSEVYTATFDNGSFELKIFEAGVYNVKATWAETGEYLAGSAQLAEALTIYAPQAINAALSLDEGAETKYAVSTDDSDPIKVNMTMTVDDEPIDIELNDLKLILTDSEGNEVDSDVYTAEFENGSFELNMPEAGVYNVKATWRETGEYLAGSAQLAEALIFYVPVEDTNVDVEVIEIYVDENTKSKVNFITVNDSPDGNTLIVFTQEAGVDLYYTQLEGESAPAPELMPMNTADATTEDADANLGLDSNYTWTKAENGNIRLNGTKGSFMAATLVNGVASPATVYYFGTEEDKEELSTGINRVIADEEGVVYYDLNGYRVRGKELKAGIYVRVLNGKATKVVVK